MSTGFVKLAVVVPVIDVSRKIAIRTSSYFTSCSCQRWLSKLATDIHDRLWSFGVAETTTNGALARRTLERLRQHHSHITEIRAHRKYVW